MPKLRKHRMPIGELCGRHTPIIAQAEDDGLAPATDTFPPRPPSAGTSGLLSAAADQMARDTRRCARSRHLWTGCIKNL